MSMKAVKSFLLMRLKNLFLAIPVALLLAVVLWFFFYVIFGLRGTPFFLFWKWSYIIIMVVDVFLAFIWMVVAHIRIYRVMRRFGASFADAEASVLDYEFHHLTGYDQWDKDEFENALYVERMAENLGRTVRDIFRR